jgi:tRNA A-37 threonylcarbamoyl transferase component Bud32
VTEPNRIGKYEVLRVLGRGGMGIVYHARDPMMGRDVAIKTLTEGFAGDPDMLRRFYQEAGHTGKLQHPNIVIVHDVGDENGQPYIVMEYLEGQPLDDIIRDEIPLHLGARLHIVEQVCLALAYAHRQGMVHRDVKPANIIVLRNGVVKLLDFGIARMDLTLTDSGLTKTGILIGTPHYMAPERFRGEAFDGRSDIFSTGVLLYQLLTGRLPFDAEYPAIIHQILEEPFPPLALDPPANNYVPQVNAILEHAMAKDPYERYLSADEMAADLNTLAVEVKSQYVTELFEQAQKLISAQEFPRAQVLLQEILRAESRHAGAKLLLSQIDKYLVRREVDRKVQHLCTEIEECLQIRDWDRASQLCEEAMRLDDKNPRVLQMRDAVIEVRSKQQEVEKLLREVENARRAGEYEDASDRARKAFELDRENSKVLRICKLLEQEVEESGRRRSSAALQQTARDHLLKRRYQDALSVLREAEALTPSDPELLRLKDEVDTALDQERRRVLRAELQQEAALAIRLEQIQALSARLDAALEEFSTDAVLLKLKLQTEQRLRELTRQQIVKETLDLCRQLAPEEAIVRIRQALTQVPGDESLRSFEAALVQRLQKQTREEQFRQYLSKAREALNNELYLETVKILEKCQAEGFSSPEIVELMDYAKATAEQRVHQELVERNFLEAQALLDQKEYEGAERLLEAVLRQVDEPALRKQLKQANAGRLVIEENADRLLAAARRLLSIGQYTAAVHMLEEEPGYMLQVKRVEETLNQSRTMAGRETAAMEAFGRCYATSEPPEMLAALDEFLAKSSNAPEAVPVQELQQGIKQRHEQYADEHLAPAIETARSAVNEDDSARAEQVLKSCAEWSNMASPAVREQLQQLLGEISAAKKLLRFRRSSKG